MMVIPLDDLDSVMKKIRTTRGLSSRIAKACGIERTAVYQWAQVPLKRIMEVADVLNVPPEQVRPDFFRQVRARERKAGKN
jgi:transcriptional regulator with XRE-family HTH domain